MELKEEEREKKEEKEKKEKSENLGKEKLIRKKIPGVFYSKERYEHVILLINDVLELVFAIYYTLLNCWQNER